MSYAPTRRYGPANYWDAVCWALLAFVLALCLSSCSGSKLPPSAPPAVPVYIPVTEACEVEQVDSTPLYTDDGAPDDIFAATQQLLADLGLLKADREKLQAANSDPCPE